MATQEQGPPLGAPTALPRRSAFIWLLTAAVGQAAFVWMILAHYGRKTLSGDLAGWNDKPLMKMSLSRSTMRK